MLPAILLLQILAVSVPAHAHDAPYMVSFSVANIENGKDSQFFVEVHPEWAPNAAKRFGALLDQGFFDEERFWKVSSGSMAQFGARADLPAEMCNTDDTQDVKQVPNSRGKLAFVPDADDKPQLLINIKDNNMMDARGFVPFAEVSGSMGIIDRIYSAYGTGSRAPSAEKMRQEGNAYLQKNFPKLSYIKSARRIQPKPKAATPAFHFTTPVPPACLGISVLLCLVLPGCWIISLTRDKSVSSQVL